MKRETMRAMLRITKALADMQRIRILMMLARGELCVCQVVEVLNLAPSTVSKHLSILAASGLVESRKEGRWGYYKLSNENTGLFIKPVMKWLLNILKDDDIIIQDVNKMKRIMETDPESLCRKQRRCR